MLGECVITEDEERTGETKPVKEVDNDSTGGTMCLEVLITSLGKIVEFPRIGEFDWLNVSMTDCGVHKLLYKEGVARWLGFPSCPILTGCEVILLEVGGVNVPIVKWIEIKISRYIIELMDV